MSFRESVFTLETGISPLIIFLYAFMLGTVAALIALAIITKWRFEYVAFPLYILIADVLATLFIFFKLGTLLGHVNEYGANEDAALK